MKNHRFVFCRFFVRVQSVILGCSPGPFHLRHWETGSRNSPNLIRIEDPKCTYLVGKNQQNEGYFIIWTGNGPIGQLDIETYRVVLEEGKRAGLKPPYHVYARYEVYQSGNVYFYKIPDKILAHLWLNENSDRYNEPPEEE